MKNDSGSKRPGWPVVLPLCMVVIAGYAACRGAPAASNGTRTADDAAIDAATVEAARSGSVPKSIELTSFFAEGGELPGEYSCFGNNTSPPLQWTGVPANAGALVIFFDEPEANGVFNRWVLYNLPARVAMLPVGVPTNADFDDGTKQGMNSAGNIGYTGPCPSDHAVHGYTFFIFAIDQPLPLPSKLLKRDVTAAMMDHIVARGEFSVMFRH